jgi:hypothetical protein
VKDKYTLEEQINQFLHDFDAEDLCFFMKHVIPLFHLYNIDDENDWVEAEVGADNAQSVRVVQTVYLISRIAEYHAGKFCRLKTTHKNLWRKLEKEAERNGSE